MMMKLGEVEALFRYPVKSMAGERLDVAELGWHGLEGDRRLAFRRVEDRGGFPWLTATKLPDLIRFAPQRRGPPLETFRRTFAHRTDRTSLCSATNWRRRSGVAMVRRSR